MRHLSTCLISVAMLFSALIPVHAQEPPAAVKDRTMVLADLSEFEDKDTLMDYWFIASYNLMLQGKGRGGILAFDPEGLEYVAGYRMDDTPEDFFTNLPNSTLVSPMFMPALVAKAIYASLGDSESISRLAYLDDDEAIMLVSVLKLYDNEEIVLEEAAFSIARQALEGSFGASGLNIQPAYDVYERHGVSQDELIDMVLSAEKTPNEISLDAIRMMKAEKETSSFDVSQYVPLLVIAVAVVGGVLLAAGIVFLAASRRMQKDGRARKEDQ